ncbi:MAG: hypothetical protein ABFS23_06795 [Pseudomonadota bacterium]
MTGGPRTNLHARCLWRAVLLTTALGNLLFAMPAVAESAAQGVGALGEPLGTATVVKPAQVLRFDGTGDSRKPFHFPRKPGELTAERSTFELLSYATMSNDLGERWALITVRNVSRGMRFLKNQHLVGTFADGRRVRARNLGDKVEGAALFTKTVFFGHGPFPLVQVESSWR